MKHLLITSFSVLCVVMAQSGAVAQTRAPIEVTPLDGRGKPTMIAPAPPASSSSLSGGAPTSMIRPNAPPERDLLRGSTPGLQYDAQGRVILTPEYCAQLSEAQTAPGVAYQGGVDVYGRPVVPADLPGGAPGAGLPIGTNILVDPSRRPGGGSIPGQPGLRQESYVGTVTVDPQGRALMNGRPLDGPQPGSIAALCAELARKP
jgi:hypothetical protein